ncbi:MAG: DNA mismatch repair protein MutS [Eubacteriales bacterium]
MTEEQDLLTYKTLDRDRITPMMVQYLEQKDKWPDAILMFRLGDFYEMFFDDAVTAAKVLELALTARDCGLEKRAPMCGVPHHAAQSYMQKLVAHGFKVAVCDQMEDPSVAKGIVRRAVTHILTPGTITDQSGLEDKKNNYLVCIYRLGMQYGLAAADITTGTFEATQLVTGNTSAKLANQIARFSPSEMICNESFLADPYYKRIIEQFPVLLSVRPDPDFSSERINSYVPGSEPDKKKAQNDLWSMGHVQTLLYRSAASALLCYLEDTQQCPLSHLHNISVYRLEDTMELDISTRRNLEMTETIRSKTRKGSLLWSIDRTKTAMGGRLLRRWLEQPLIQVTDILPRQDAVEEARESFMLRQELLESISGIHDLERLTSRIALGSVHARDLLALRNSLAKLPAISELAARFTRGVFEEINRLLDTMEDVCTLLNDSLADEPPIGLKDGGILKEGYNEEVDRLRVASRDGKSLIMNLEAQEKEKSGIRTMKVGYNRVFGYYLEVSKGSIAMVPDYYIRKQTLANAERYITEELKSLEDTILGAQQKLIALEYDIFCRIREQISAQSSRLQGTSQAIAMLDVILSLGELADREKFVRPLLDDSDTLEIVDGRHPVVEKMLPAGSFVPNDTYLDNLNRRIIILTGPNMAGKSTYMRQVALIILLAQMGSFVPAASAHIGIVDRIFTRIGASDDLTSGQSTFMVEMNEVSTILRNATRRSLLILDEVGRGTSTYDGLSIAWAILEFISDPEVIFARTLFATHYHELNMLESQIAGIVNAHVDVDERDGEIIFLHRIADGGTDDSYGIEVARLAGVPVEVVERAKDILHELESERKIHGGPLSEVLAGDPDKLPSTDPMKGQLDIFDKKARYSVRIDPIRQELKDMDITHMTPLEAMNTLYAMISKARE